VDPQREAPAERKKENRFEAPCLESRRQCHSLWHS
jgi:hypothetical protein